MLLMWARPWLLFGSCTTQVSLTLSLYGGSQSVEERPAASKLILQHPENRTELLYVSEGGKKVRDHMLFLLAVKQDDLIKSSAKFYMSGTKLLLLREGSKSYC